MAVVFMIEWDVPKERDRYERYVEYHTGKVRSARVQKYSNYVKWLREKVEEGVLKRGDWGDNTGQIINWNEFESIELFSEMWANEEWQNHMMELIPLVDNIRYRLFKPSLGIQEGTS